MLVPEHEIVPGEEQWHPAVCTECAAGCGTIVRVMEGVRTIERNGEKLHERIAAIKKIEGNPLDPVSGGRLCARGQAAVQALYHPTVFAVHASRDSHLLGGGDLGDSRKDCEGRPQPHRIRSGPGVGTRSISIARFMEAIGGPPPVVASLLDFAAERKAAEEVFGWKGLPVFDMAYAHSVLGVGADFLGGWMSPVYYSRSMALSGRAVYRCGGGWCRRSRDCH